MAKEILSVGDLPRKSEVSADEIAAAADAYLKAESAKPFAFKSGHTLDVAKSIEMHPQAKKLLADEAAKLLRIGQRTFDGHVARGDIAYIAIGLGEKRIRKQFDPEDIAQFWER
ncbi:hypothetical protein [Methylobacterium sp. DCY52]|jgi:hypothetical protein|uniref:hypothetical protein n=1 Tax=Methylobacterium sp. DCY52 TaxID=739139 RepID=UPI003144DC0C